MRINYSFKLISKLVFTFLAFSCVSFYSIAQSEPFNCDFNAYLFQCNDIYALDLASGSSYLVAENITPGNVNWVGYNPADGYLCGYLSSPSQSVVRIGRDFQVEQYTIPELPTGNKYVGDISNDDIYYFKAGASSYLKVTLNLASDSYKTKRFGSRALHI